MEVDIAQYIGKRIEAARLTEDALSLRFDTHEAQFLHVRTDLGTIVCETHNEHNGCYGGFRVLVSEVA